MIITQHQKPLKSLVFWVGTAVILLVLTAIRLAFPPALGIVPGEAVVTFEFRNSSVAEEFRLINPQADASGSLTGA